MNAIVVIVVSEKGFFKGQVRSEAECKEVFRLIRKGAGYFPWKRLSGRHGYSYAGPEGDVFEVGGCFNPPADFDPEETCRLLRQAGISARVGWPE